MARQEHVLSVFVASPGDVNEERNKLEEVIRELNITWSRELGLRLDLVRWETHAYPGMGQDPQDVINGEIPDDYDIFIGIMWHRFGTPTGRYGSGTIEEFERARKRSKESSSAVKTMFYFRDSPPISMSHIDGNELVKIQNFRRELGPEGTLYWQYTDISAFEKFLRLHLSRQVQAWNSQDKQKKPTENTDKIITEINEDYELGYIDLADIFEEQFESISGIVERIRSNLEELTTKVNPHAAEFSKLGQFGIADPRIARQEAKKIMSRFSLDMNQFAERIGVEIPLFRESINKGLNAFIKSVEVSIDFADNEKYEAQMADALVSVEGMNTAISSTLGSLEGFRNSTSNFPRMTGEINRAKRQVVTVLDHLIFELNAGNNLGREAAEAIRDRLRH
ncbi:DUF4062 domain-containing protein [Mesorhizobium sp. B2-5-4]|uniref:DUF4062 domain-containing protein n=1 Tax=Mesorhizobium sp. B2-5-4 TaxID=2589926 RepID=UPI0015E405D1|nr:DUF4062 domain-containing protein [Mesorhizobium sp. B2-5-4]